MEWEKDEFVPLESLVLFHDKEKKVNLPPVDPVSCAPLVLGNESQDLSNALSSWTYRDMMTEVQDVISPNFESIGEFGRPCIIRDELMVECTVLNHSYLCTFDLKALGGIQDALQQCTMLPPTSNRGHIVAVSDERLAHVSTDTGTVRILSRDEMIGWRSSEHKQEKRPDGGDIRDAVCFQDKLCIGGHNEELMLYDVETLKLLDTKPLGDIIGSIQWTQPHIISCTTDSGSLWFLDPRDASQKPATEFQINKDTGLYAHVFYTEHDALLGYGDGEIIQVDARNNRSVIGCTRDPFVEAIGSIVFAENRQQFVVSGAGGVSIWKSNPATGRASPRNWWAEVGGRGSLTYAILCPNSGSVVASNQAGKIGQLRMLPAEIEATTVGLQSTRSKTDTEKTAPGSMMMMSMSSST